MRRRDHPARLLGRFLHADRELHQLVRGHLAAEEALRPGRVFAEVVHLPEGRVGNILCRPVLRGYEIPYLGRSGASADRQLPVSDLLVSVEGERIVLRSGRLGCEVIPRLSTAHNHFGRGLGVYRFLCALQLQQVVPGIMWDWGPLGQAPFLPRVVSGRVNLSRARWNLRDSELAAFREPRGARQFAAVQRLRERRRMPRYVALADGDNELAVDLDNVLSLETLAHELRGRAFASFIEVVPRDPDWHLRLRIHGAPDWLLHETLPLLHRLTAPLLETGQLWRVQLDTYEREVERYGGEAGIGLAERAFHADSDAVLAIVRELTGDAGAELRWRVALHGVDLLFDDLGLTLEQKLAIARRARDGYGREFGADGGFQRQVSRRYRDERASVEALLDPERDPPAGLAASIGALRRRSTVLAQVGSELRALADAGRLSVEIPELAMSLAHMHVNRMLRSAQRAQELVLYELLGRAYSSRAARRAR